MLEPLWGVFGRFPNRAKWAAQGPRRRKSAPSRRAGSGSISPSVMAPCGSREILTTHLRSRLKMQRFEPSIDLDFAIGILGTACQLETIFWITFLPSSISPRDTVEMQGFELVAIFVATSDLQKIVR